MRGNVIGFDPDTNTGAISGHDGNRYDFVTLEWHGAHPPRRGDIVDFQAIEQRATEIHLIEPAYLRPTLLQFYFSPVGRIARSQYWLKFVLPYFVTVLALQIAELASGPSSVAGSAISTLLTVFSLVAFWPSIAVVVKRMHDRNKSGWLMLALVIPAMLFAILLVAWIGAAALAIAAGHVVPALGPLGAIGVVTIGVGAAVVGVQIWFFVEFGCMRGTIGVNRFGPDPLRR